MLQESVSNMSLYEDEEDYSPSSSAFESCSSDLTDASTVASISSCLKEDQSEDYLIFPPIILPFHESLSFNILGLYRVMYTIFAYMYMHINTIK